MQRYIIRMRQRRSHHVWNVTSDDGPWGVYLSEYAALLDAIDAAQEGGEMGHPAQVLVHGKDGSDVIRWTYGDPYPYQCDQQVG